MLRGLAATTVFVLLRAASVLSAVTKNKAEFRGVRGGVERNNNNTICFDLPVPKSEEQKNGRSSNAHSADVAAALHWQR